jgi:hypothetical protein
VYEFDFFLDSKYEWDHKVFVFFAWLISFSITFSKLSHAAANNWA